MRRSPFKDSNLVYNNQICPFVKDEKECPYKDSWNFSHNEFEVEFHPCNFKTLEYDQENEGECNLGVRCSFVHSNEIKRDPTSYLDANKILLEPEECCWDLATKSGSFPEIASQDDTPHLPNWTENSASSPFTVPTQTRHSMNYKNLPFSPLKGYSQGQGYKKYSSDYKIDEYFEYSDNGSGYKWNLPNDSWHYQIQLQQTVKSTTGK